MGDGVHNFREMLEYVLCEDVGNCDIWGIEAHGQFVGLFDT